MKKCVTCKEEKKEEDFNKNSRKKNGKSNVCRSCAYATVKKWRRNNPEKAKAGDRRTRLKYEYKITEEDYERILKKQKGLCAICMSEPDKFHIDHRHSDGKVRGLLCFNCNLGLGHFKDNEYSLMKAVYYLRLA